MNNTKLSFLDLMKKYIDAAWLENETREDLRLVLGEYRFLVSRFVQWIGLTFAKSSDETVRQLLLHNIVEECSEIGGPPSHLGRLDLCLASCGVLAPQSHTPLASTRRIENWFFDLFSNQDCHACLSALGPGTESISQQFLVPLEAGIRKAFAGEAVDYGYFDVHRPEVESVHAEDLDKAIALVENAASPSERERLLRSRQFWSAETIAQHAAFWAELRQHLHP